MLDFDGGGQTTRVTHHKEHANNIRCLNPNVMFQTFDEDGDVREAIDYPATHRRVMKIGQTLVDWAAKPGDRPRLHSVLFTAIDLWDEVAKNCMFIEDLGTAPDGIGAKSSLMSKLACDSIGKSEPHGSTNSPRLLAPYVAWSPRLFGNPLQRPTR